MQNEKNPEIFVINENQEKAFKLVRTEGVLQAEVKTKTRDKKVPPLIYVDADDAITIAGRSTDEKEQEANYFASCLLMPEDEVDKFLDLEIADLKNKGLTAMDIARIMSEFNVSFEMALNRLENLGKISGNERVRLDNERIQLRVGKLLRSVGGNQRLNEATGEIEIPHEYIEYVIDNYNHNVIPQETLEKVLECYHLTIDDISDKLVGREEAEDDDLDALLGGIAD